MFKRLNSRLEAERFWRFCQVFSEAEINICIVLIIGPLLTLENPLVGSIFTVLGFLLWIFSIKINILATRKLCMTQRDRIQNMILENFSK